MPRLLLALLFVVGCATTKAPQMRVIGVHARDTVFVQVTNPASRPLRLTKLDYTFAADGTTVSTGVLPLERDVPAGAAVVVEVPIDSEAKAPLTLTGTITAELDNLVRNFQVSAQIQPH